jgi:3-isopropylmalate dehydrogenase
MSIGLTPFLSFEPIHGSAPRYEGKGMVNNVASIESVKMMLDHLGEEEAIRDIEEAVSKILSEGKFKIRETGREHSTSEMGDAIQKAVLD